MTGLVAQSLTGALWQAEPYAVSPEVALRHAGLFTQQYDMPDTLSLLLAQRGVTPEISDFFLTPNYVIYCQIPLIFRIWIRHAHY